MVESRHRTGGKAVSTDFRGIVILIKAGIRNVVRKMYEELHNADIDTSETQAANENAILARKIKYWTSYMRIFMPDVPAAEEPLEESAEADIPDACEMAILLPSALDAEVRRACPEKLIRLEVLLQEQQARQALEGVRRFTRTQQQLTTKKWQHVSGPGQLKNTRSSKGIQTIAKQKDKHVRRYREARNALLRLTPRGASWEKELEELNDVDLELPSKALGDKAKRDKTKGTKGGSRAILPWIWGKENAAILDEEVGVDEGK